MTGRLSQYQVERYQRDGVVFPVPLLSPAEVSQCRGALQSLADAHFGGSLKRIDNLHFFFDWASRLATHEALADAVETILGQDILVYSTLIFTKPPNDSSYVSWHQDSAYSNLHLSPSVSAWIALALSNEHSGCMRVIPGSHRLGRLEHGNVSDDANLLQRGEHVIAEVDDDRALDVVLQPGEVSLHQSNLIHGSNPNRSNEPRVGFIVRYVTSNFAGRSGLPVMRVRGDGESDHLELVERPVPADMSSAFAAWQEFRPG